MKYCILTPRFPYPENGGDVLRINHVASYLKQQGHRLCLISFVQGDSYSKEEASSLYDSVYCVPIHKWQSYLYSLLYLLIGKPMQCGYYHSRVFKHMLQEVIEKERPDCFVAHLLRMTPYLETLELQQQSIVEMTDALSKTYALARHSRGGGLMRWIYKLEHSRILSYEKQVIAKFPRVVLVSQKDVDYLQALCPTTKSLVCRPNGVECMSQTVSLYQPYKICFVGNMRTLQNQDAVLNFVNDVFPLILKKQPDAVFYIIGGDPPAKIKSLASEHIVLTGFVPDVQISISDSCVMVAPVHVAAGIQNKVLVAMGCGVPVVLTPLIAQAIPELENGKNCIIADTPNEIASGVLDIMANPTKRNAIGLAGYRMVTHDYTWTSKLQGYEILC